MKKYFASLLVVLSLACMQLAPLAVSAVGEDDDLLGVNYGSQSGLQKTDPRIIVARVIQVALGFLGTVALVIIIYAGFEWMTAGGDSEKAGSARSRIYAAVMGLIIILSAYALSAFVIKQLYQAINNTVYLE